ncbi:unnamed protein product [Brassica oleracea var. botrytis]
MSLDVNITSNVGLQGSLDSIVISWAYGFINHSTSTVTVNLRKVNNVRGYWSARNSA